jgi:hypothetical protein
MYRNEVFLVNIKNRLVCFRHFYLHLNYEKEVDQARYH